MVKIDESTKDDGLLPTAMKLKYRSVGLTRQQFEELKGDGISLQDLTPGHYVRIVDAGRQCSANDLHVVAVNLDHFVGHNPGRDETSDFYFGTMNGELSYQMGRDYFLIPSDKYTGPTGK